MSDDNKQGPVSIGDWLKSFDAFGAWAPGKSDRPLVVGKSDEAKAALRDLIQELDKPRARRLGRR